MRLTVCVNYYLQESIPVACVLPLANRACFSGQPPESGGLPVNKFERVSSVGHQILVAGGVGHRSEVHGVPYHVAYPMMHLMLPMPSPRVERQTPVKTLHPATSFASGKHSTIHLLSCLLPSNGCPQVSHLNGCTFSCCLATCLFSDDPVVNDISQLSTGHLYGRSPTSQMFLCFFIFVARRESLLWLLLPFCMKTLGRWQGLANSFSQPV